ncbi:hypothetical protein ACIBCN_19090 [Nocardia sp. NPDC051052]|uniref:hypothetical protein n=1 Tax=Nocardia sp. NPDC051052 TaxID=3364322 RepID=UPI0037A10819
MSGHDKTQLVAEAVRMEMARQQKKTPELARAIGCSPRTARNRLSGLYPFEIDELLAASGWLRVPLSHLTAEAEATMKAAM